MRIDDKMKGDKVNPRNLKLNLNEEGGLIK